MIKYEYKIIILQTKTLIGIKPLKEGNDTFNELGNYGWELVSVIPMVFAGGTPEIRCFFKREIKK